MNVFSIIKSKGSEVKLTLIKRQINRNTAVTVLVFPLLSPLTKFGLTAKT